MVGEFSSVNPNKVDVALMLAGKRFQSSHNAFTVWVIGFDKDVSKRKTIFGVGCKVVWCDFVEKRSSMVANEFSNAFVGE